MHVFEALARKSAKFPCGAVLDIGGQITPCFNSELFVSQSVQTIPNVLFINQLFINVVTITLLTRSKWVIAGKTKFRSMGYSHIR